MDAPQLIGTVSAFKGINKRWWDIFVFKEADLINYLKEELDSRDKEVFLVVRKDVEKEQGWLLDQASYSNAIQERDAEVLQLKDIVNEDFNVVYNTTNKVSTKTVLRHSNGQQKKN